MNAVAVILASGSGQRFGSQQLPKHLTHILDIPLLAWTVDTAVRSKIFSSIAVVTREEDIQITETSLKQHLSDFPIPLYVTEGAEQRIQSFLRGLDTLRQKDHLNQSTIVALMDANRPFTPIVQLQSMYDLAVEYECSCPVRPVVNGVARFKAGRIIEVPEKSGFVEFVTPEFINYGTLTQSMEKNSEGFRSMVEYALALGHKPMTLEAGALNTKLTFPEDKIFLEKLALENRLTKPSSE